MGDDDLFHETCAGCVHFLGVKDSKNGNCMRYPPTPVPVMQQQAPAIMTAGNQGQAQGFGVVSIRAPVMADTPACGEYETPEEGDDSPGGQS